MAGDILATIRESKNEGGELDVRKGTLHEGMGLKGISTRTNRRSTTKLRFDFWRQRMFICKNVDDWGTYNTGG